MKTGILAVLITMVCLACEQAPNSPSTITDPQLLVGDWRLIKPVSSFKTTLSVGIDQPSGGTISGIYSLKFTGDAAVNTYVTTALLVNSATGSIDVKAISTTKMAGSPDAMLFEQNYYTKLKAATRYELTSPNTLRLYSGSSTSDVLIFEKLN
ncbi:META domain-containing protein [Spirosoma aerolatum]|uniref:META domain-containing protein n=1 Tax=Spirosoma aerolatum TaxID=1211326 RepID=UPI0009ADB72D|nr:META domain-containing protein [Spirosoma aerolatum]